MACVRVCVWGTYRGEVGGFIIIIIITFVFSQWSGLINNWKFKRKKQKNFRCRHNGLHVSSHWEMGNHNLCYFLNCLLSLFLGLKVYWSWITITKVAGLNF